MLLLPLLTQLNCNLKPLLYCNIMFFSCFYVCCKPFLCQCFYAYPLDKCLLILESVVVHYLYRLNSTENMKCKLVSYVMCTSHECALWKIVGSLVL